MKLCGLFTCKNGVYRFVCELNMILHVSRLVRLLKIKSQVSKVMISIIVKCQEFLALDTSISTKYIGQLVKSVLVQVFVCHKLQVLCMEEIIALQHVNPNFPVELQVWSQENFQICRNLRYQDFIMLKSSSQSVKISYRQYPLFSTHKYTVFKMRKFDCTL